MSESNEFRLENSLKLNGKSVQNSACQRKTPARQRTAIQMQTDYKNKKLEYVQIDKNASARAELQRNRGL